MKRTILVWLIAGTLLLIAAPTFPVGAQEREASEGNEKETYTYTVREGDTLWDISEKLYRDPWVWPKVWQWNPAITNPHWIYPGTELELYYKLPKPMAALPAVEEAAPEPVQPVPPPPPPPAPKPPSITFREIDQVGFITPYRPVGSGVIVGEIHEKVLIGMADMVFVQIRPPIQAEVGDRYFIISTSDLIRHPVTNEEVGYLNTIQGILKIVEVAPTHAKALIQRSFDAIAAGDKLIPYEKKSEEIVLREGIEPREGNILLAKGHRRLMADHQIVFIDLGEKEDIQAGNRFEVFRVPRGTGRLGREAEIVFTAEPIGELLILSAERETAAAIVTRCKSELFPGERVRLKMQN